MEQERGPRENLCKALLGKNNLRGESLQISCDAVLDPPPRSILKRKLALRGPPSWLNTSLIFF